MTNELYTITVYHSFTASPVPCIVTVELLKGIHNNRSAKQYDMFLDNKP